MLRNQDDIRRRMNEVYESTGLSSRAFALTCGIDPSAFAKLTKGTVKITDRTLLLLNKNLGVSMMWLSDGEGDMMEPGHELCKQRAVSNHIASQYNSGNAHGNTQSISTPDDKIKAMEDNIALLKKMVEDKDKEISFLRDLLLRNADKSK